jgi:nucleoid-associated protein YgaU
VIEEETPMSETPGGNPERLGPAEREAARQARQDAREELREERKGARQERREERQDARAEAREHRTHAVESGDTLNEIAARFRVDRHELVRLNKLDNPDRIYPGQVLKIPNK